MSEMRSNQLVDMPCLYCYGEDENCDRCAGEGHLIIRWRDFKTMVEERIAAQPEIPEADQS